MLITLICSPGAALHFCCDYLVTVTLTWCMHVTHVELTIPSTATATAVKELFNTGHHCPSLIRSKTGLLLKKW